MRILLVEDDPEMAEALATVLRRHGVVLDSASTLAIAREAIAREIHDVVLIDRQLPDGDGLSLIRLLHSHRKHTPAIVISALGTSRDRIAGLDTGADDYLPKPFEVDELLARIRAVRRRAPEAPVRNIGLADLMFDLETREATVGSNRLNLTHKELLILECLLRRPGRTILKGTLEEALYGFDDDIASNSIEANVSRLRKKLIDSGSRIELHNIRGVGYFIKAADK